MHFLADENIPDSLIKTLRVANFDVLDLKEENLFGISDKKVLEIAHKENRAIITLDKDFLYLAQQKRSLKTTVLILRFLNKNPKNISAKFLDLLKSFQTKKFEKTISIISDYYVEIIKY